MPVHIPLDGTLRVPKVAERLTSIAWDRVTLPALTQVTGASAAVSTSVPAYIRERLGFRAAGLRRDRRPVFVFFHWPHRHEAHGKAMDALCGRVLDNEILARRLLLFRTVRVEMEHSNLGLAQRVGAKPRPGFVVLNPDMKVVARFDGVKSASKLARRLAAVYAEAFPALQSALDQDIRFQSQHVAAAQRLAKGARDRQALHFVNRVRFGAIRVHQSYDEAVSLGHRLDRRLAADKAK